MRRPVDRVAEWSAACRHRRRHRHRHRLLRHHRPHSRQTLMRRADDYRCRPGSHRRSDRPRHEARTTDAPVRIDAENHSPGNRRSPVGGDPDRDHVVRRFGIAVRRRRVCHRSSSAAAPTSSSARRVALISHRHACWSVASSRASSLTGRKLFRYAAHPVRNSRKASGTILLFSCSGSA